jgi:hypothetical protein
MATQSGRNNNSAMVFEFYIFHRTSDTAPLFHKSYYREAPEGAPDNVIKLVRLLSNFLKNMGRTDAAGTGTKAITTNHYKLHHFSTATGYNFVLLTDVGYETDFGQQVLRAIYDRAFVELVAKDPNFKHNGEVPITSELFATRLDQILHEFGLR